jgi:NAD(P)-dependent dehydrogenase (short-subunit alcohol dehydrogenase family)
VAELAEATAAREGVSVEVVEKRTVQNIPLGRMAEASELADLVVFLASDRARYITGTTIPVDGGYLRGLL